MPAISTDECLPLSCDWRPSAVPGLVDCVALRWARVTTDAQGAHDVFPDSLVGSFGPVAVDRMFKELMFNFRLSDLLFTGCS